jgi:succinyl-CoA synthetase alpha subunit
MFQNDPETRVVVLLGEVGGTMEHEAASFIRERMDKPVIAMIVGRSAPPSAQMGHAGAIVEGEQTTADSKIQALQEAGAWIAYRPTEVAALIKKHVLECQ